MGWVGGALTLGSLAGTLPAGALSRKIGLRSVLIVLFITAPLINAMRAAWVWLPAQIGFAFLAGLAMSSWGVCFLPAIARLTTEKNRTSAFSLIFSVSVGTSILGGIVSGYLRQWLAMAGIAMQAVEVKRLILLLACGVAFLGIVPVLALRVPDEQKGPDEAPSPNAWLRQWRFNPFLLRFLPLMALWAGVLTFFTPFANVYLSRDLHIPMTRIGLIFSAVQVIQLGMGLLAPVFFRALGLIRGIAATQALSAAVLAAMAMAKSGQFAIAAYLTFSAIQWMSSPGLYNLLMDKTPDADRSTAAAMTLFSNSLVGSLATAMAGTLFTRYGYPPVLLGLAGVALMIALLFLILLSPQHAPAPTQL
jgi:MFS family permease